MLPEVWGPGAWTFLHTITIHYPDNPNEDQKFYHKQLFENLRYTIPCEKCANHYSENLKKYPLEPALESKTTLTKWLIDIHNEVNKKNGKRIYSYEEVEKIYKDMYSMKNNNNIIVNNEINWNIILIIIVIILIGYFLYKEYS